MSEIRYEICDSGRFHYPAHEKLAWNQMPKDSSHKDARLFRYPGTDLYQWFSKVNGSVFEDAFGEPFRIAAFTSAQQHALY